MWQQVKIPFKPPQSKLYEVSGKVEKIERSLRSLNPQIESVYPKLVKQIKILKNDLAKSTAMSKELGFQKSRLGQEIENIEDQKSRLQTQIVRLEERIENLREQLAKVSVSDRGEDSKDHVFVNLPLEYVDVEERLLDERGQPGDPY